MGVVTPLVTTFHCQAYSVGAVFFVNHPSMLTQNSSKRADLGSGRTVELRDGGREAGAGDSELGEFLLGPYKGHRGLCQGPLHLNRVHTQEARGRKRGALPASGINHLSIPQVSCLTRLRLGATMTLGCMRPLASCKCSS